MNKVANIVYVVQYLILTLFEYILPVMNKYHIFMGLVCFLMNIFCFIDYNRYLAVFVHSLVSYYISLCLQELFSTQNFCHRVINSLNFTSVFYLCVCILFFVDTIDFTLSKGCNSTCVDLHIYIHRIGVL